jgi:hypothetical protein
MLDGGPKGVNLCSCGDTCELFAGGEPWKLGRGGLSMAGLELDGVRERGAAGVGGAEKRLRRDDDGWCAGDLADVCSRVAVVGGCPAFGPIGETDIFNSSTSPLSAAPYIDSRLV